MKRTIPLIAAVTFAFNFDVPAGASPQFVSGNYLYEQCSANETNYMSQTYCLAYIVGVADAGAGWQDATNRMLYCLSPEMTTSQIKDVAVAYLRAHPETRHYAAAGLVTTALKEAFPCSTSK